MGETTTIEVSRETWRELNQRKQAPGDTFDDVVTRLLDCPSAEISDETISQLRELRDSEEDTVDDIIQTLLVKAEGN